MSFIIRRLLHSCNCNVQTLNFSRTLLSYSLRRTLSTFPSVEVTSNETEEEINSDIVENLTTRYDSVFEEKLIDVSHIGPDFKPSFNFAAFANHSVVIQELVKLGVNFYQLERRRTIPSYLLQLDYEKDIQPYLRFLHDHGVPADKLGFFITYNPDIFKQHLDDLQVRINYLEWKKFTAEMIARLITANPLWLNKTTAEIDKTLGYFQKLFKLSGNELRHIITAQPLFTLMKFKDIQFQIFQFQNVMGFSKEQCKSILLAKPSLWIKDSRMIKQSLEVLQVEMGIPQELIVADISGLRCRAKRLQQRHAYLKSLGRAQYDPKLPNYVSQSAIVKGSDAEFCRDVAKTSVDTYNLFLKTL